MPKNERKEAIFLIKKASKGEKSTLKNASRQCKDGTIAKVSIICLPIIVDKKQVGICKIYRNVIKPGENKVTPGNRNE